MSSQNVSRSKKNSPGDEESELINSSLERYESFRTNYTSSPRRRDIVTVNDRAIIVKKDNFEQISLRANVTMTSF